MSAPSPDLTRWNRAGRDRFDYVDGNAATFLEDLRQSLLRIFPHWAPDLGEPAADETEVERLDRLVAQLRGDRKDPGFEIVRALARSAHVLTSHLDAFANEGYLETATQWENVRRLVDMLDYRPGPPASASTPLVLTVPEGDGGTVETGLKVKHTPADGSAPVVFETLADLDVHPALNAVNLAGWNVSEATLSETEGEPIWFAPLDAGVSAGQPALLVNDATGDAAPLFVTAVDPDTGAVTFENASPAVIWSGWAMGEVRLLLLPAAVRRPRLNGTGVVTTAEPHGLEPGDAVAWEEGGVWKADTVAKADARGFTLSGAGAPPAGKKLYRAAPVGRDADNNMRFPEKFRTVFKKSGADYVPLVLDTDYTIIDEHDYPDAPGAYSELLSTDVPTVYLVGDAVPAAGDVVSAAAGEYVFDGGPGDLAGGRWVVGASGTDHFPFTVVKVTEDEDHFNLQLSGPAVDVLDSLHGPFLVEVLPLGHDRSPDPLPAVDVPLAAEEGMPDEFWSLLVEGRQVLVERETDERDGFTEPFLAAMTDVDADAGTFDLDPRPPASFTVGNTVIRANVVLAGHGESRPEKVLGSGDPAQSRQSFVLQADEVSFVADASQSAGVRADVTVKVGERIYRQVSNLSESGPAEADYAVSMTEDGYVRFQFGDGKNGRRLPGGANNVRVRYRTGTGAAGNLPAGSLAKLVRPHRLVEEVRQPLEAGGGNDMEDVESLRTNAPPTVLTMERAVSLDDFASLAASQSSVWQAAAFARPGPDPEHTEPRLDPGRTWIEVVVVPAGGGELGALEDSIRDHLLAHSLPGVVITVLPYVPVAFGLTVTVRIRYEEYEAAGVLERVRTALFDEFSLERRRLGQDLYLSEVYHVVEGVEGVENSKVVLDGDPGLSRLPRISDSAFKERTVIHLVSGESIVDLIPEEYSL